MLTAAGCSSGDSSNTKGTKKFPQAPTKMKMKTTAIPGRISGTTTRVNVASIDAPSTQAASSSTIGTESMKFFIIQIAIGRLVADMNRMIPGIESIRLKATNRL